MPHHGFQKPLIYALSVFILGLFLSLLSGIYVRNKIDSWINTSLQERVKKTEVLIKSQLSHYKTAYYEIAGLLNKLNKINPEATDIILKEGNLNEWMEKPEMVAIISKNSAELLYADNTKNKETLVQELHTEMLSENFQHFVRISLAENRPVFYDAFYDSQGHRLISLIPIDSVDKKLVYIMLNYNLLFVDVEKSDILHGDTSLALKAYVVNTEKNINNLVFSANVPEQINASLRRQESTKQFNSKIPHEGGELNIVYEEIKNQGYISKLRQLPFMFTAIGVCISVLLFGLIFVTLISFMEQQYIQTLTSKK